jgi:DNA-binding NarL/FixJ family response regulator
VPRLLIADDHPLIRTTLTRLFRGAEGIDLVGMASSGGEATEVARRTRPDVALMDLRMPSMGGVEATRRIKEDAPGVRVIILTAVYDHEQVVAALAAGAARVLLKDVAPRDLIEAVREA